MVVLKTIIILKEIIFASALLYDAIKNKKQFHLDVIMSAFCIANITILAFGL